MSVNVAAILGVCFLLTHIVAPVTTVLAAIVLVQTPRPELCWRRWRTRVLWMAMPWLATALVLAAVGLNPIDAMLHFDGLLGPVPIASLVGAAAVAVGIAVRCRRAAES